MRHFFRQCRMPILCLVLAAAISARAQEKSLQVNGIAVGDRPHLSSIIIGDKYFSASGGKTKNKNNEIPGLGNLKSIDKKKQFIVVEDKNGTLQKIRITIVSGEVLRQGGQESGNISREEYHPNEGYYPGPESGSEAYESPAYSGEPYMGSGFSPDSHDEPPPGESPQPQPLPPGGIPAGPTTTNSTDTAVAPTGTEKTPNVAGETNPGLVSSKSQIFAVSANSGPIWGDHLLYIEVRDLPTDKKVEIFLGDKLCKRLQIISKTSLTCITPPSDRDEQVELSLKIDGQITDSLSYRYQNSEDRKDIRATSGIPNRVYETVVHANGKIFVWGGVDKKYQGVTNGAIYDTVRDTWSMMETAGQPAPSAGAVSVFTGQEIIVWGGKTKAGYTNLGGIYNLQQKRWRKMISLDPKTVPSARAFAAAVWTGSKMIVWGGEDKLGQRLNSGATYDVQTQNWTPISIPESFLGRSHHFAYWDGTEMKVWGGYQAGIVGTPGIMGAYKPETNQWRSITTALFSPRVFHRDLGWAWFSGSKFMLQGPKNSPDLGSLRWPIFFDNEIEGWPMDQSPLPVLRNFPEVPNIQGQHPTAVWSGRYLFVFTDGANGFRYSFP